MPSVCGLHDRSMTAGRRRSLNGHIADLRSLRMHQLTRRVMPMFPRLMGAAALAASVFATSAAAVDITGAGATFPYPIYAKWADAYRKQTGVGLNYQSIGSG